MTWWRRQFGGTTRGQVIALLRRGRRSVEELASALGLTPNAVRAQLTTLERDGLVTAVGVRRERTVGKPATYYGLAPETDTLFSGAYAPTLAALVAELGEALPPATLEAILRGAGRRLAPSVPGARTVDDRVRAAAALVGELGGDADLVATDGGYELHAYGCPLARAVAARPETCRALEALIAGTTGTPVHEHCDRQGPPQCRFTIAGADGATPDAA